MPILNVCQAQKKTKKQRRFETMKDRLAAKKIQTFKVFKKNKVHAGTRTSDLRINSPISTG
jgi:hypothetical protein